MAEPTHGLIELRRLIDQVQKALALEGIDSEAQERVVHRLVYGVPRGSAPIPMQRYTSVDLTISAELLRQQHPAAVPEGVRYGASDILGRLYARAADVNDPFAYGRILNWDLRFEPAADRQSFGAYTMRATAEIERANKPVTVAEMNDAIDTVLQRHPQRRYGVPET